MSKKEVVRFKVWQDGKKNKKQRGGLAVPNIKLLASYGSPTGSKIQMEH